MDMEEKSMKNLYLYEKSIFHCGQIDLHNSWQFGEQKEELIPRDY